MSFTSYNKELGLHNFLFEMYLAELDTGVLVWDSTWEEFCFITSMAWDHLDVENKKGLEIIKQFDKPFKRKSK